MEQSEFEFGCKRKQMC